MGDSDWQEIGKLRLHANVARFGRNVTVKPSHADEGKRSPKTSINNDGEDIHVLDLSQAILYEFPLAIL
nr:hypothetical protein [Tanacetum cinerariifolium]